MLTAALRENHNWHHWYGPGWRLRLTARVLPGWIIRTSRWVYCSCFDGRPLGWRAVLLHTADKLP